MSIDPDKVTEKQMADWLGTTHRALQAKRYRNQIPEGIWNLVGRTIYYSKRRYEEWREAQWNCPPELNSAAGQYESGSREPVKDVPKRSRTQTRQQVSQQRAVYEIR